jgi:hypothetical protein
MTITVAHAPTRTTGVPDGAHLLIAPLHAAISACAELDPDLLHSTTELGSTVVSLASIARAASRALGVDAGTDLNSGSGVMVVRDLVAAVQVLEIAVTRATLADRQHLRFFVPSATGLSAALLELTCAVQD